MRALIREIHATERGAASAKALKKTGPFSVGGTGRSLSDWRDRVREGEAGFKAKTRGGQGRARSTL